MTPQTPQEKLAALRAAAGKAPITKGQQEDGRGNGTGVTAASVDSSTSSVASSSPIDSPSEPKPGVVVSTTAASIPTTLSAFDQISNRIAELQISLAQQLPNYENLLKVIHTALVKDEATVHLLTEEQIGVIVAGLCTKKHIVIAESTRKNASTSSNKKLAATTVDDL